MISHKCRTIGKYEISDLCLLSYPCQHYIKNTETGESSRMSGANIFCMLRDDGLSDTHFNDYAEYIRKRDNPTPEEIAEKETQNRINEERREQQKREKEEKERITNSYKASSRLERLKAKNNVTGNVFA